MTLNKLPYALLALCLTGLYGCENLNTVDGGDDGTTDDGTSDGGSDDLPEPTGGLAADSYFIDVPRQWPIGASETNEAILMFLWMSFDVDEDGRFTGTLSNGWAASRSPESYVSVCNHDISGVLVQEDTDLNVSVQMFLADIPAADCDPAAPGVQEAWTDAMRDQFTWIGLVELGDIEPTWTVEGDNLAGDSDAFVIEDFAASYTLLDRVATHAAVVDGLADDVGYFNANPTMDPYAFFGVVELDLPPEE